MKITNTGRAASLALIAALALSACGSDDNAGGSSSTNGGSSNNSSSEGSGSGSTGGDAECGTTAITAEGSSAQDSAIQEAIAGYKGKCSGANVTYNKTGSGAGIKQFIAKQVTFAGSDSALKSKVVDGKVEQAEADKACTSPAWNLPLVTGPIAITYNLSGVDKVVLTPDLLADIFNGKITKWDDAAIKAVNKDANLPGKAIKVMFRSDESGTTENLTKYLAGSAPKKWTAEPGKKWTGKGEGKSKTDGVAQAVKATDGAIGYVEWGAAKDNKLSYAQIDNGAGAVELTGETAGKAVGAAKIEGEGHNLKLKLDYATKTPGAYPILLVTYEIVCSKYSDAKVGASVKSFLSYFAADDTQKTIEEIGYAPLPGEIATKVKAAIAAIK